MSNNNNMDNEVLAAISAAIAAMSTKHGVRLEVKAIRRVHQSSPVWNSTGRVERLRRNLNS